MDTVSMLNKMRFYCQPILPLVYDESMSYYETLCKVVGQLNTTGDTVNKLNEGLTGEIADRQAADAALDERLKVIEDTNVKSHFLVFDGANPNGGFPTRHELYQWVEAGDAIFTLFRTHEEGRGQIYAASCNYNAGNWGSEASNDFSIIVPLETTYDSTGKLAVKQKVAKLTIPPIPQTNLNVRWGLQIIEINTPYTSAEGIVNFSATVDNENTVHANLSPAEFTSLYRAISKGAGLIVGVNAQLTTNDSQLLLSTTADIIGGETASDDEVRIVFDAETSTGERGLDLPYLNRMIYILSGSGTAETWTLTEFEMRDFAFDRDEGFQFTRAANNVITPSFGSTPKEVAEYFGTVKGGTPYQNLPVRLIDTVDNAEYWNGTFHSYSDGHMTFTFVTSHYTTESNEMLVKTIELSATKAGSDWADSDTWKYGVQEFRIPIKDVVTYTASTVGDGEYDAARHKTEYQVDFVEGIPAIIASIEAGKRVILKINLKDPDSSESYPIYFSSGYTRVDPFTNSAHYIFTGTLGDDQFTLELNSLLTHATFTTYGYILPEPNPDGSDSGKVPAVNGTKWELKELPVDNVLSSTSVNPVQNKVVKAALDGKASTAVATASSNGLMSSADKTKLDGVAVGANKTIVDTALSSTSTNPVQNKAVKAALDTKAGTAVATTSTSGLMSAGDKTKLGGVEDGATRVIVDSAMSATSTNTVQNKVIKKYVDDHSAAPVDTAMSDTSTNAVQNKVIKKYIDDSVAGGGSSDNAVLYTAQTLTDEQKKQARKNIEAADSAVPTISGPVSLCPSRITDSNDAVHVTTTRAGGDDFTLTLDGGPENQPVRVKGIRTPTDTETNAAANVAYILSKGYLTLDTLPKYGGETA